MFYLWQIQEAKAIQCSNLLNQTNLLFQTGDKMRIDSDIVRGFFKESVDSVVEHVKKLLMEPAVSGCSAIVMVGGFSESPLLQETVREKFSKLRVIVPREAGLAVLKGAVIFGHRPATIAQRISKFTYGVACTTPFNSLIHPASRKIINDEGNEEVDESFSIHVKAGEELKTDSVQSTQSYGVSTAIQDGMTIRFFATTKTNPVFVDEPGCNQIGVMQVVVPGYGKDRKTFVSLKFGATEIEASAKIHTGEVTTAKIDFLG